MTVPQLEIKKHDSQLSDDDKLKYFKSHFKIIPKNFGYKGHQMAEETFNIRINCLEFKGAKRREFFKLFEK